MAKTYSFEGLIPVIKHGAFVHPTAVLIGDVVVEAGCFIGPGAALRGDFGRIEIGPGANVQDNCVVHTFPGRTVVIAEDGHIGHAAVIHGCTIGRNSLVGMNATVMDDAVIGAEAIVAANSFVKAGFQVPPRTLVAGVPAKILRQLSDQDVAWKSKATAEYQALARRSLASLEAVEALSEEERERPRAAERADVKPLHATKSSAG